MLDARQEVTLCGGVAPQLVRDDDAWGVLQALQQLVKETLGGVRIAPALHKDIEHVTVRIYCAPEILQLASEADEHFVQ